VRRRQRRAHPKISTRQDETKKGTGASIKDDQYKSNQRLSKSNGRMKEIRENEGKAPWEVESEGIWDCMHYKNETQAGDQCTRRSSRVPASGYIQSEHRIYSFLGIG
jgi:hypothetical protein